MNHGIHITLPQLCAYLDDELTEASAELVRRHLSECMECTEHFGRLEAQEDLLLRILSDNPEEEFFQQLSASIPLGEPTKAAPAPSSERKKSRPAPTKREMKERRRLEFNRPIAWLAAAVCCIVAGSAAWVAFHPRDAAPPSSLAVVKRPSRAPSPEVLQEPTPEPTEAPTSEPASEPIPEWAAEPTEAPMAAPEQLVERSPRHVVPVRTIITETVVGSVPPDSTPIVAVPRALSRGAASDLAVIAFRDAKSASLEAAKSKLPASFDKSAEAWERALPLLEDSPETLAVARRELAQSRFQAWAAEPTPLRREAAIASARRYLLFAAPGPDRDQAWTWLGRLKH